MDNKIPISGLVIAIVSLIWIIGFFSWYVDKPSFNTIKTESSSKMKAMYQKKPLREIILSNQTPRQTIDIDRDDTNVTYIVTTAETTPNFSYTINLPNSDGTGHQYEFIFNSDIDTTNASIDFFAKNNTDLFYGTAVSGNGTTTKIYASGDFGSGAPNGIGINDQSPYDKLGGTPGILKGTRYTFTDYTVGRWITRIDCIGSSDMAAGSFQNPFTG